MQHGEEDEDDDDEKKPGKDYDEDEDDPADDDEDDDDEEPLRVRPQLLQENCSDPFYSSLSSRTSVFIATSLRRRLASISPVAK